MNGGQLHLENYRLSCVYILMSWFQDFGWKTLQKQIYIWLILLFPFYRNSLVCDHIMGLFLLFSYFNAAVLFPSKSNIHEVNSSNKGKSD
jgi:hypothetical protein